MNRLLRPRVLLAEDHRMVAEGLKNLLVGAFELVGVVEDGRALIAAARTSEPEVIVADISMPNLNGIDALAELKKDNPNVKVVLLSMHRDAAYVRRALEGGASAFVLKHSAHSELIRAIRAALSGRTYITPSLADELFRRTQPARAVTDPVAKLTPRQREILQLLAEGRSAREIAETLAISSRTVEFHKYQMMETLGLHHTAELIHFAIKQGIVTI